MPEYKNRGSGMGIVIRLPLRHARASARSARGARAAKSTKISGLRPASFAAEVARIADHHSDGMLYRCHHLETWAGVAPISDAKASRVGQSSMIERNEVVFDMQPELGHHVLKSKAELSCDYRNQIGHNVRMKDSAESIERERFIARTKQARMASFSTQQPMLTILEIDQGTYKQYETRTPLPHRFIPKFCAATNVSMEWLLTGIGKAPEAIASVPLAKLKDKRVRKARAHPQAVARG